LSCRNRKKTGTRPDFNRKRPDHRLRSLSILEPPVAGCATLGMSKKPTTTCFNRLQPGTQVIGAWSIYSCIYCMYSGGERWQRGSCNSM
jgi:hypothetical protein